MSEQKLPRWNMEPIYPSFTSPEWLLAKKRLLELSRLTTEACLAVPDGIGNFASWLKTVLALQNEADSLSRTLGSYCYTHYSVDTKNSLVMQELNAVEELQVPFARAEVLFMNAIANRKDDVFTLLEKDAGIQAFRFYLEDTLFWQTHRMSPAEEDLAADLARSGADAWGRLQEQLTAGASCVWDEEGGERKTLVELRSLAYSFDRGIRAKAYEKELKLCRSIETGVAAALNGVKGTAITLNSRRKWSGGALEKSVSQSRLSKKTLDALITALEDSLPSWRRYLVAKASVLGVEQCAFYDLFAPVGTLNTSWDWEKGCAAIIETFSAFSPKMGSFARTAIEEQWIDAEPRAGKIGGAYCTDLPSAGVTRVMCNYDNTFNAVSTLAHELGHAWHSEVLMDLPALQQNYPMTLAETASTFAETLLLERTLQYASEGDRLSLIETHLQDGCQILVDILSRYYFEQALMEERCTGELSAQRLCELMRDAQLQTYGAGLDSEQLHPWMWLIKTHYYSADLAFYNYPYAFGQLLALALFAEYRKKGSEFATAYDFLLRQSGRMDAVAVTAAAGFDIESVEFWRSGVRLFEEQITQFENLVAESRHR